MIPEFAITEWSSVVPWKEKEQVEQDLLICRALTEIYKDEYLAMHLAFRGGTAQHKLYLQPQPRYSEDIDLVQVTAEPIKETYIHLRQALAFLGDTEGLLRFGQTFDPVRAFELVKATFIDRLPGRRD